MWPSLPSAAPPQSGSKECSRAAFQELQIKWTVGNSNLTPPPRRSGFLPWHTSYPRICQKRRASLLWRTVLHNEWLLDLYIVNLSSSTHWKDIGQVLQPKETMQMEKGAREELMLAFRLPFVVPCSVQVFWCNKKLNSSILELMLTYNSVCLLCIFFLGCFSSHLFISFWTVIWYTSQTKQLHLQGNILCC